MRTEAIYEGLFDDEALGRIPSLLAKAAGARSALMMWFHGDGGGESVAYSYFDRNWIEGYAQFAEQDPYKAVGLRPENLNRALNMSEHISAEAFKKSIIFNEFVRKQGDDTLYCIGSGMQSSAGSGIIGLHRGASAKPFEPDNVSRFSQIAGHAKAVLRARGELSAARRSEMLLKGTLDHIDFAAITVSRQGRVLFANRGAASVLGRNQELHLCQGRLTCRELRSQRALERAIELATGLVRSGSSFVIDRGDAGWPYLVSVVPVIRHETNGAALVLFRDPDGSDRSSEYILRNLYGLTAAESSVAADIARGHSLLEIARRRAVQVSTVRAQLKSISAKADLHRQSEIAALISRLPSVRFEPFAASTAPPI